MGRRIRKGSFQHRMIERRMQDLFADSRNAEVDPETGVLVVKGQDTFQRAADYVAGKSEATYAGPHKERGESLTGFFERLDQEYDEERRSFWEAADHG